MTIDQYNTFIEETLNLGYKLIYDRIDLKNIDEFVLNVSRITKFGYKLSLSEPQSKTCEIIDSVKIDDFKLSFIEQVFFADGKGTQFKVNSQNTAKQIKKRYILYINSHLPILKI